MCLFGGGLTASSLASDTPDKAESSPLPPQPHRAPGAVARNVDLSQYDGHRVFRAQLRLKVFGRPYLRPSARDRMAASFARVTIYPPPSR
jgi:hypothetical protein